MITKTIHKKEDYYIQFTDEEMKELDIKPGDKFSWEIENEGIALKKYVSLEIDLSEFDKDTLICLIQASCDQDISVNEVIVNALEAIIEKEDAK